MIKQMQELEKVYAKEIKTIINELAKERHSGIESQNLSKFGNEISYLFNITEHKEYDQYVEMLNQVEEYNPKLAESIEEYFNKELNLIALLSLHAAISKLKLS